MANIREIQGRMKSIQDTMKITNAMYMISSTKLRRARKKLEETEKYFSTLKEMVRYITRNIPEIENVYLDNRPQKTEQERVRGLIVVTADKGLAGAYNHNVLKLAGEQVAQHTNCKLFVVGELGRQYFATKKIPVEEHFHYTAQNPSLHRARFISETVLEQFKSGALDEVYIVYTNLKNGMNMETLAQRLLPLERYRDDEETGYGEDLWFMPSPETVLSNVIPDCVMGYVYGALVESFCSEQNARMMAMEAANKNASAMIHELSIEYNRMRQAMITQEITEVVAGAKAQKKKKGREAGGVG
ncbi:MAG: ATP synthase F1 subunit gamma [Candidatus Gastranaerophilales bacterium]|nr:ATP synthase F1 subunit gamma [Candidatus Gastranaerophilales bacterium]